MNVHLKPLSFTLPHTYPCCFSSESAEQGRQSARDSHPLDEVTKIKKHSQELGQQRYSEVEMSQCLSRESTIIIHSYFCDSVILIDISIHLMR